MRLHNFFSALLLLSTLTACSFSAEVTPSEVTHELSTENAQELSEGFFLALDADVKGTGEYLFDTLEEDYDAISNIVEQTKFHDPQDITVNTVENGEGTFYTGEIYFKSNAIGTFTCEGSDHASDFDLMWMHNENDSRWELINLNFEEC